MTGKVLSILLFINFFGIWSCSKQTTTTVNIRFLNLTRTMEAPSGVNLRLVRRLTEQIKTIEMMSERLVEDLKVFEKTYNLSQTPLTEKAIRQWYKMARQALFIETSIMRLYRNRAEYRILTFNKEPFEDFIKDVLQATRRLINDILLAMEHKM